MLTEIWAKKVSYYSTGRNIKNSIIVMESNMEIPKKSKVDLTYDIAISILAI